MVTWDLGTFTSYELGKVADAFRARIEELPHAPAGPTLRSACVNHLLVDQRYQDAWTDPTFLPRYSWLRDNLQAADGRPLAKCEARDVVDAIDALVAKLEARDA